MREVNRIILHYLGEGDSRNYVGQAAVDGIREYHTKINGWSDIGYHFLIDRDGHLYPGRPEGLVGAHAYGANTGSIGINLMYGTKDSTVTNATLNTVVLLLKQLCSRHNIVPSNKTIIGHKDVMATECPGIVYSYIPSIIQSLTKEPQVEPVGHALDTNEMGRMTLSYKGKLYDGLMINNQSFIAVSKLAKMLGTGVEWDGSTKTATIK